MILAARSEAARILAKRLVTTGIIPVTNPKFRVVDDGHQDIVELMGRRSRQFAQGCQCLHLPQLVLEVLGVLLLVSDRIAAMVAVCGERLRMHVQLKICPKVFHTG